MTKLTLGSPFEISAFPTTYLHDGPNHSVDIADLVDEIKTVVEFLASQGIVKETESFGFAVAFDGFVGDPIDPDDPSEYVGFVGGWGPDKDRYIANAVRKLRVTLEIEDDSMNITHTGGNDDYNGVKSAEDDGSFLWGNFPWGGSTYTAFGKYEILVSVSALKQDEDDLVAGYIGKRIGMAYSRADDTSAK